MENNSQKLDSSKNIQILSVVINNNIYNLNELNLNNILMPFLMRYNKQNYYNAKKNSFIFPEAIDIDSLQLFCKFLLTPEKVDTTKFTELKKILNICIFFNAIEIINNISQKFILSKLSKNNCLDIIIFFSDFIYTEIEAIKNIFSNIIKEALLLVAQNLIYFINNKKEELLSLNGEILEEIIELYFKENDNKRLLKEDIKNIIELLIYSRGISNDIFLLLENERKKAISKFESLFNKNNIKNKPTFIWKITYDDIKKNNYQEKTTNIDGINILLISYYDNINDSFQLAMQILDYFNNSNLNTDKNDDEFLNTSTAKKIINKKNHLLSKEKENNLINILSLCEISEINFKSHINFNGIYSKNNSRFLICKIDKFFKKLKNQNNAFDFSLKLYFSRNYIFPKIIEHICQDFKKYYCLPSINKIPRSAMNILLKNENILTVQNNENYKLFSLINWIKNKNGHISKKDIDIFKNIDWKKIDNNTLIEFFMKNAKIIDKEETLKNDLFFEIQRRFQEEYSFYYLNNKTYIDNSQSISLSNFKEIQGKNNHLSFTFDFLTKILSYLILYNNKDSRLSDYFSNEEYTRNIIYPFPEQEEKENNYPKTQRNKIPKNNISKNIVAKNSPLTNEHKNRLANVTIKIRNTKIKNKNKLNKKNSYNNIPTSKYKKKTSNNSLSSNQINISAFSGIDYFNSRSENLSLLINTNKNNKHKNKNKKNISFNRGIKSLAPNNSKGKLINTKNKEIINNNKFNRTLIYKHLKNEYKNNKSKSVGGFASLGEDKNIPFNFSDKKIGLFPNYIRNIQNDKKDLNKIKKKYHI